jgi:hypothetical protein
MCAGTGLRGKLTVSGPHPIPLTTTIKRHSNWQWIAKGNGLRLRHKEFTLDFSGITGRPGLLCGGMSVANCIFRSGVLEHPSR